MWAHGNISNLGILGETYCSTDLHLMKLKLSLHLRALCSRKEGGTFAQTHKFQTQNVHFYSSQQKISPFNTHPVNATFKTSQFSNTHNLFDEMPQWDIVSATKSITQSAKEGKYEESFFLLKKMLEVNLMPNEFTFGALVPSATSLRYLKLGEQLHSCAKKIGFFSNVYVGSAFVNMYSKLSTIDDARRAFEDTYEPNVVSYTTLICGYLQKKCYEEALKLFGSMPERNVVTWNAVIGGLGQTGRNEDAVDLFIHMLREGYLPNNTTFSCVISSVSNIAVLGMGRSFHASTIKFLGDSLDVVVSNSLISFYSKCGNLDDSLLIFDRLAEKSIVTWNALICGYAQNGRGKEALNLFRELQNTGTKPNSVTLLGVLIACNYIGLVSEGYSYFNETRYNDPRLLKPEHYACMIDLFSRFGLFEEAKRFINDLPFEDLGIGFWKALLGGFQIHDNVELGEIVAKKILALDPGDVSSYVMLANAHSAAGRWKDASMVRQEMREREMSRVPGCSWIEIKNRVFVFTNGNIRHGNTDEIFMVLRCFLVDVEERKKFDLLSEPCIQIHDHS